MTDDVSIDRDSLVILLEYAYRGEAAQHGHCRHDRMDGCAFCDALTSAENALGPDAPADLDWWTPTLRERVRALIRR